MKALEPQAISTANCPICLASSCLDNCATTLQKYFGLLEVADGRILSVKPGSTHSTSPKAIALIDKLNCDIESPPTLKEISDRLAKNHIESKIVFLKGRQKHLCIGPQSEGTFLRVSGATNPLATALISRPSGFSSFVKYNQRIASILSPDEIMSLRIKRVDLAIDVSMPFATLLPCLNIRNKRVAVAYDTKDGRCTGIHIAKAPHSICIYDKAEESKLAEPLSRIEVRLSGKHLPCTRIAKLSHSLLTPNYSPFKQVELLDVRIADDRIGMSSAAKNRRDELTVLLKRQSYFQVRKQLGQHNNFDRDYAPLLTATPWNIDLNGVFRTSMGKFLAQPPTIKLASAPEYAN